MSRHRRTSMNNSIKDRLEDIKEWIFDHTKIVMPIVLLICVMITIIIAVGANKKAAEEVEAQAEAAETAEATVIEENVEELQVPLEENAYPAVNELVNKYYEALAAGDVDAIAAINSFLDDTEKIRIQEMSRYIDDYPEINVFTKAGPVENSYLVYVYSKVKFTEYEELVPGMEAFYVCTDENGSCYMNEGEDNSVIVNYLTNISLQDDVVDLNNKVVAEYSELLESDEELKAFIADLTKRIDISVGEALAKAEAPAEAETPAAEAETAAAEQTENGDGAAEQEANGDTVTAGGEAATIKTVRATDVVNVRSSDSETADKVGKAQVGEEFTLLEEKGNGWSRITFENKDAYIKSEFLEVVAEEAAADEPAEAAEPEHTETQTASTGDGTTVTVIENVNVRKTASETGEKLGLAYIGEKMELVMKQADGWTKVKYKGQTAYVKSDFVE